MKKSKRNKSRSSEVIRVSDNHEIIKHGDAPNVSSMQQAFEAARHSGYRGWWFLPTLDTATMMPQFTREQIAKKVIWCYNNIGCIRAIIDGLALDEVDTSIWAKADTSSPEFNRAVKARFDMEHADPRTFDLRGVENIDTAQFLQRRSVRLFGDMFAQLIRPLTDSSPPLVSFLPGYQCVSGVNDDPQLREGIRFDGDTGAPAAFRFAVHGGDGEPDYRELPAGDVLHLHDPFFADQIRGISTLAPVVRKMFSMNDIERAETSGQILRSRMAYSIETKGPDDTGGPRIKAPGSKQTDVITNADGSKTFIQKVIAYDGSEIDVMTPPQGATVELVESQRGGAIEFHNWLATDVAHSTIYPPVWVYFLADLTQGTIGRLVQNRVQRVASFFRRNQIAAQFLRRWYQYALWQRMRAGAFDYIGELPRDWWVHKIHYPADLSVDIGREGKLYDDRVMRSNMTAQDYQAMQGRDADEVDDEIIAQAIERRKKLAAALKANPDAGKLEYKDIWPGPGNAAGGDSQHVLTTDEPGDTPAQDKNKKKGGNANEE